MAARIQWLTVLDYLYCEVFKYLMVLHSLKYDYSLFKITLAVKKNQ